MSLEITWVTESTRQDPEGGDRIDMSFDMLTLDIVEDDSLEGSATVTSRPVGAAAQVSDHVVPEQKRAECTAAIAGRQHTTGYVDGASHGTTELGSGREVDGIVVPDGADRLTDVHETLLQLMDDAVELDVVGLQLELRGWYLTRVSAQRRLDTSGALIVRLRFVDVVRAETEQVDAPSPRVERGRPRSDEGRQGGEEGDEDTEVSDDAEDRSEALDNLESHADALVDSFL